MTTVETLKLAKLVADAREALTQHRFKARYLPTDIRRILQAFIDLAEKRL